MLDECLRKADKQIFHPFLPPDHVYRSHCLALCGFDDGCSRGHRQQRHRAGCHHHLRVVRAAAHRPGGLRDGHTSAQTRQQSQGAG